MKYYILIASLCMLSLVACSKDDDKTELSKNEIPYVAGTSERQYLEDVSIDFLNCINANDQRATSVVINHFAKMCDNYAFPENFYDERPTTASRDVAELAECIDTYDVGGLSRAVTAFAYNMARFKGLYQPNEADKCWEYIESRDDLAFRFMYGNSVYNMIIKYEDGAWTESINVGDATYSIDIPHTLKVILYDGQIMADKRLFYALIKIDGKDGERFNITSDVNYANVYVQSTTKANNTKIDEEMNFYVSDTKTLFRNEMITSKHTVTGTNLCSLQAWVNAIDKSEGIGKLVSNITSVYRIIKRVQIKSYVTDANTFFNNIDACDYKNLGTDPKTEAERAAKALTSSVTAEMYYAGDPNEVRATIGWEPYLSDQYDNMTWQVRPTITFTSDNATFDFAAYFGKGRFMESERKVKSLITSYRSFWQ